MHRYPQHPSARDAAPARLWRRCHMEITDLDRQFASTHGVFTAPMAEQHGFTARMVRRWLQHRRIVRVAGRAFIRSGRPITLRHRTIAALLTWPDAVICFRTAAVLHGMPMEDDGVVHVVVPDGRRELPGLRAHRWSVRPMEVTQVGPIVMTDWRTTLADCLGRLGSDDAWGMLAWMYTHDQMTERDLAAQITDRFHLYGIVRLRLMLKAVRRRALSVGELHLQDFLAECGFTGWIGDFPVLRNGRIVARGDIGFRAQRLIVEFDGKLAHQGKEERDARRDARINRAGYDVLHVTWAILYEKRRQLRDTIRAMLAAPPRSARRAALAEALTGGSGNAEESGTAVDGGAHQAG